MSQAAYKACHPRVTVRVGLTAALPLLQCHISLSPVAAGSVGVDSALLLAICDLQMLFPQPGPLDGRVKHERASPLTGSFP